MGNFLSIWSGQNVMEVVPVKSKVEKYSSQDSKPVSQNSKSVSQSSKPVGQNSKSVSQNSKPVSRTSQLEGSGLENSKPMSQTVQLEDPWLESSKPWSPAYLGPSEDHFQRLECYDFPRSENDYFRLFEGDDVQSFEVDNQQDKKEYCVGCDAAAFVSAALGLLMCKYKSPGAKQLQRRHSSYAT
ncbi:hypothetical protein Ancab_023751 [Ancistrocladus abbreviatus]